MWKNTSVKEKEPFEALAKRDKDRYTKDKKEYEAGKKATGATKKVKGVYDVEVDDEEDI